MLKIGEFSRLAQVSIRALRLYDRLGLLRPAYVDRFTSYRYYGLEQLPRLHRVLALKDLGFSLEEVRHLLQEEMPVAELRGMLRLRQAELERTLNTEQARLARVAARLEHLIRGATGAEVVLKPQPALRVAGLRRRLDDFTQVGVLLQELWQAVGPMEVGVSPLALYYDAAYRERGADVEAALPLERRIGPAAALPAEVRLHTLPAVETMACTLHQGPYDEISLAYESLLPWIPANGLRVAGVGREVYLRGPESGAPPQQFLTEVQFPVTSILSIWPEEMRRRLMEPKIVVRESFTVVGMAYRGKNEHGEISALWGQTAPRFNEIHFASGDWESYGVCRDESDAIHYLAGIPVTQVADLPAGMEAWTVPANTYAVFPCTLATISQAYDYALNTWLPSSGYRRAPGPDFEHYPPNWHEDMERREMYIYIPVTR